jgi:tetratricopeptide (TPR) repeat protein
VTVALLILALTVPVAVFVLWPLRRIREPGLLGAAEIERAELEAEKLAALRALRELALDHEAGHLAADDYADLRARAEARAAAILRQLDARETAPSPLTPPPAGPRRPARTGGTRIPWTRQPAVLGLAAVGILVFGVVLGVLVTRFLTPEPAPMAGPPDTRPGGAPPLAGAGPGGPTSSGSPRPIPPEVLAGMLQAAHASLDAGRYQEAIAAYKAVLARHPDNVEAMTHLGVILAQAGHADGALEAFDRALAIDPGYAHAWWDKAGVLFDQKQDYAGAITAWERFLALAPAEGPDRDQARARIQDARQRLAAGAKTPAAAAPGPAPLPRPAGPATPATP